MTHDVVRELLPAYLDAEEHGAGAIEAHLATCEACTAVLATYRGMLAELSALPDGDPSPPAGLAARVVAQIPERSTAARIRGAAREHPLVVVAGVGGAAIAAVAAVYAIRRAKRSSPDVAAATA